MFAHYYIKNLYRLVAVDLSRETKLDDDSKGVNFGGKQSVFVLIFLGKIKETRLKFSQGSVRKSKSEQEKE